MNRLAYPPWICNSCRRHAREIGRKRVAFRQQGRWCLTQRRWTNQGRLERTRNIGIIAHIDAGKTTTTERMLYYSGFTRRLGDVDEGSTVTDFLPAERARGITIQSAAITFHWPPLPTGRSKPSLPTSNTDSHTINLIDTPGHADFTFEVTRSLRILDGAVCILDGVAGVEAQTEKVWTQANAYQIPRLVFVNKLDREGAAFHRSVKEIASRLHSWPVLCQIPWWKNGKLVGVGDAVNFQGISWEGSADGSDYRAMSVEELSEHDEHFAHELRSARSALTESLTEHDDVLVEAFLQANEDLSALSAESLRQSLRRTILAGQQKITPVFVGASFRNVGVQPLLDAVHQLLPSPLETTDPSLSLGHSVTSLRKFLDGDSVLHQLTGNGKPHASVPQASTESLQRLSACALAFKVVNDSLRGVLVYVRIYSGSLTRNALLYNTNLGLSERAQRMMRMYANEPVEIDSIEEGQIGVIAGLKHARTGDTLIVYSGATAKTGPPAPFDSLQLQPIAIPPPLFFASIEPGSLSEEKALEEGLALLLREDPSLSVTKDPDSGQTQLAGLGELHLEIARDRLLNDFKVKASMGKIEIGYRETVVEPSGPTTRSFEREVSGKQAVASCTASVEPREEPRLEEGGDGKTQRFELFDNNLLIIEHPSINQKGRYASSADSSLASRLSLRSAIIALRSGVTAALARGPAYGLPVHSTRIAIRFDPSEHVTPTTDASTLTTASRFAVTAALKAAARRKSAVLMEPVMLVTIAVNESAIGDVVHDLNSARGAQVMTLDAAAEEDSAGAAQTQNDLDQRRLTPAQIDRVYAPLDPFGDTDNRSATDEVSMSMRMRQIKARVPLKEMVGYLKHLRSLTGGRGSFVMSIDQFEKMSTQRMRSALSEMRGDYV